MPTLFRKMNEFFVHSIGCKTNLIFGEVSFRVRYGAPQLTNCSIASLLPMFWVTLVAPIFTWGYAGLIPVYRSSLSRRTWQIKTKTRLIIPAWPQPLRDRETTSSDQGNDNFECYQLPTVLYVRAAASAVVAVAVAWTWEWARPTVREGSRFPRAARRLLSRSMLYT